MIVSDFDTIMVVTLLALTSHGMGWWAIRHRKRSSTQPRSHGAGRTKFELSVMMLSDTP